MEGKKDEVDGRRVRKGRQGVRREGGRRWRKEIKKGGEKRRGKKMKKRNDDVKK